MCWYISPVLNPRAPSASAAATSSRIFVRSSGVAGRLASPMTTCRTFRCPVMATMLHDVLASRTVSLYSPIVSHVQS